MHSYRLEYFYTPTNFFTDKKGIGDIFPFCIDGLHFTKGRNVVGTMTFSLSLKQLYRASVTTSDTAKRIFLPLQASVVLYIDDIPSWGGYLVNTPQIQTSESSDTVVQLTFADWLGYCAGMIIQPIPYPYNGSAMTVFTNFINDFRQRATTYGCPVTVGGGDLTAAISGTIDNYKTIKDFMLDRSDNTTGAGTFDIYFDWQGKAWFYKKYGSNLAGKVVFRYPSRNDRYGIRSISAPAWSNYVNKYYLTGAGQGYGSEGDSIESTSLNSAAAALMGYYEAGGSESDISIQNTLDSKATSYTARAHLAYSMPTFNMDANNFVVAAHIDGGDLWIGDTVSLDVSGDLASFLPISTVSNMRVDSIDATIDGNGSMNMNVGMMV